VLSATIRLDLSRPGADLLDADEDREDRRALSCFERLPDGADVVVYVGNRKFPSCSAARAIHEHEPRLNLRLEAGPDSDVRRWLAAGRTGEVSP
jgi:hypothetical protein